tara:strand:+ start:1252 stop:1470 length:219 start_codon:yes stop_codon:yes gene_type:complete
MREKTNWVNLFKTTNRIEAYQILSLLESNGIKFIPIDKIDSSYNNFGYFEVLVSEKNYIKANSIVTEFKKSG